MDKMRVRRRAWAFGATLLKLVVHAVCAVVYFPVEMPLLLGTVGIYRW